MCYCGDLPDVLAIADEVITCRADLISGVKRTLLELVSRSVIEGASEPRLISTF
jgi:hypothetical protein